MALPASFSNGMKNRVLNPAYAFALCYAAMVCLAIAVNLMPIFLTTLRVDLGGRAGLTGEQLGRISAITFTGLVGGIFSLASWPIGIPPSDGSAGASEGAVSLGEDEPYGRGSCSRLTVVL